MTRRPGRVLAALLILPAWLLALALGATAPAPAAAEPLQVNKADLVSIGPLGWIAPRIAVPAPDPARPLVAPDLDDPGARLLARLQGQGRAGGFDGIAYENRDRGHSPLPETRYPALTHLRYGPELVKEQMDYGLAGRIIFPFIVIGNSSTALTSGVNARSQPRLAMTSPGGPERAYLTYANNHLYVYPEHRDHDLEDRFPAAWPYMVISQGSSYSDEPFLDALLMTLAALPTETLEFLRERKLIAPTLQMILRRNAAGLYNRLDYFHGKAHPTAFPKGRLAPERMIAFASALKADEVPPMVHLEVETEDFAPLAGLAGLSEMLFDTPSAIARVWRSEAFEREMTISAARTADPNGRELSFEWVLLRGHPDKVDITLLDGPGTRARIKVRWHDAYPALPGEQRSTNRVDIGVFASNGVHDSAPAFVSISFPHHQQRVYERVSPDGPVRLKSVDYRGREGLYFDPMLHWSADWRDTFEHDASGDLVKWTRILPDQTMTILDPDSPGIEPRPAHELITTRKGTRVRMVGVPED